MRLPVIFAIPVVLAANAAAVDVPSLIKASVAATQRNFNESDSFSFVERDVERKLDASGAAKSQTVKTYEVTMIDGSPYNRLIKVNDRPLAPDAERNERRKMEAEQKHRRAQSQSDRAKRIARYRREHEQDRAMLKEMAEAFNYTLVGQEIVKGRPAYVLEAAPKPGYVPKSRDTKVLPAMRGKLWIDQADKQWVRVEAEVIRPVSFYAVASVGPGTRFIYEQAPVNAGLWMPSHFEVRVNSSVFWMARNSSTDESYSNYRRISEHSAALP